jgi:hypothetical protein
MNPSRKDQTVRQFRVAFSLQLAFLILGSAAAWSQETASADDPSVEHVRHLRSHKAAKPILSTDEDKPEAKQAAEPASRTATAAKSTADDTAKASTAKKKVAAKPAAPKPAVKQRAAARRDIPPSATSSAGAAPASRGFLEDIFGDN